MEEKSEKFGIKDRIKYENDSKRQMESDTSSSSDESDEENWMKIKEKRMRLEVEKRQKLLTLNIKDIKTEFIDSVSRKKTTKPKSKLKKVESLPTRRSLRLVKTEEEKQKILSNLESLKDEEPTKYDRVSTLEHKMISIDDGHRDIKTEKKVRDLSVILQSEEEDFRQEDTSSLTNYINEMKKAVSKGCFYKKVMNNRITCLELSPKCDLKLVAAGDKLGYLSLWNVSKSNSEENCQLFRAHSASLRSLKFHPSNPHHLVSAGYDGCIRIADLNKLSFQSALVNDYDNSFSCFEISKTDHNKMVIGTMKGDITFQDMRTSQSENDFYDIHDRTVKSVSLHPSCDNYLLTASNDRSVKIFDIRNINKKAPNPLVSLRHHSKAVNSAYFSPVTGNYVISASLDDSIKIYDTSVISETSINCIKSVAHNMTTGRWLSVFRATWVPEREDVFMLGSMDKIRQINLFDTNLNLRLVLSDEGLTTICSTLCHHPALNFLVGGNSSGKVFVYDST